LAGVTPIRARSAVPALAALAAASAPAAASAATLRLDRSCYTKNQTVRVSGSGYRPNQVQTIFRSGSAKPLGTLTADGSGAIAGHFSAPAPSRRVTARRTYTLTASASASGSPVAAHTTFKVVHTDIQVIPPFITPGFVIYSALGFTYGQVLYVHYLQGKHHLATGRIGHLSAPCASLRKKVKMFLFRPVTAGIYTLVFDNSARYSATYRPNFSFEARVPDTFI
jgi:hypothetical protein